MLQLLLKKTINLKKQSSVCKVKSNSTNHDIKHHSKLIHFYTGLQNYGVFTWLFDRVKDKAKHLHYYRGESSFVLKKHQLKVKKKKSGRHRQLSAEDDCLMTLIRLRVGVTEIDLAFRFKVNQSTVSQILATWIAFLGKELNGLIIWPSRDEFQRYYPKCFSKFPNVIGIIDCTAGTLEKPSLAKAQSQTYSLYKSHNNWKTLLCIAPAGTISFISQCYDGLGSDRYITETSGLLDKLDYDDNIMADRGFNISDLLVSKGSKLNSTIFT